MLQNPHAAEVQSRPGSPKKSGARAKSAPRSGKSIFLHMGGKPMVTASAKNINPHNAMTPAMERIAQGRSGHDLKGKLQVRHPSIPVRPRTHQPPTDELDSAYPRQGSVHSLQYSSVVERSGAYKAPYAGRGSISVYPSAPLAEDVEANWQEHYATNSETATPTKALVEAHRPRSFTPPKAEPMSPGSPSERRGGSVERLQSIFARKRTPSKRPPEGPRGPAKIIHAQTLRGLQAQLSEIRFSSAPQTPTPAADVQRSQSAPKLGQKIVPRSGKSIFHHMMNKPMVIPTPRSVSTPSPTIQRFVEGSPAHDPLPVGRQPPAITPRGVNHQPEMLQFDSAYPRHGSIHSLQYHGAL